MTASLPRAKAPRSSLLLICCTRNTIQAWPAIPLDERYHAGWSVGTRGGDETGRGQTCRTGVGGGKLEKKEREDAVEGVREGDESDAL